MRPFSCALRGILSAHVSAPQPTSAQAIINIRFLVVSPLRTSPGRDNGARTCRSYIMLVYNKIQNPPVRTPYFRVGTNKAYL